MSKSGKSWIIITAKPIPNDVCLVPSWFPIVEIRHNKERSENKVFEQIGDSESFKIVPNITRNAKIFKDFESREKSSKF